MTAELLVVHHTPSPAVAELLAAAIDAVAAEPELAGVAVRAEPALSATAADLLGAAGVLLLTPANIGYMSGALKHFFDTVYYPCQGATRGLPYGLVVHGNNDTAGAVRSVTRIADAMEWRAAAPPVSVIGPPSAADRAASGELAATVAAMAGE